MPSHAVALRSAALAHASAQDACDPILLDGARSALVVLARDDEAPVEVRRVAGVLAEMCARKPKIDRTSGLHDRRR